MSILIVDDSPPVLRLLEATLERDGYKDVHCFKSGVEALDFLSKNISEGGRELDCVLLDIVMPEMDGIEVCRAIKEQERFAGTPVIMVTIKDDSETLRDAFEVGAVDYITKPVRELELLARVKAAIKLKNEMLHRKDRESELIEMQKQLTEANHLLAEMSITDEVTKVGNRRYFNDCLDQEWRRSFRESGPLSIIFMDIDHFQEYSNHFGQGKAEECLKLIAQVLQISLRRVGDHLARYSGSQFAVYLPKTDINGALIVAKCMKESVSALQLNNAAVGKDTLITISQGLACLIPSAGAAISNLKIMAESALHEAKEADSGAIITHA